jgi:hypothetical protein
VLNINKSFQALRSKPLLRWLVAVYLISVSAAMASPVLKPQAMQLLCTSMGASSWVALDEEGKSPKSTHSHDCALCFLSAALPSTDAPVVAAPLLSFYLSDALPALFAASTLPPLPARGPPANLPRSL